MHVLDDVLPVDNQFNVSRQPQRGVQNRPVLRGVDMHPREHLVAPLLLIVVFAQRVPCARG